MLWASLLARYWTRRILQSSTAISCSCASKSRGLGGVLIKEGTYQAVKAFYETRLAEGKDAVMFPPGESANPTNKWVKRIGKFFDKAGLDVKTHDFRVTAATRLYSESGNNILVVQNYLGHSDVKVT